MAASNQELYFEHLKGQAQFAYFQLGLAASAIAFAIHETRGKALLDTPWPVGVAVVLWAVSFALGCFGMTARQQGLATNVRYLQALRGVSPDHMTNPELRDAISEAKQITESDVSRPLWRFRWQLWMLFIGALFYIGGHVMQMAAIPPSGSKRIEASKAMPEPQQHPTL